MVNYSNAKVYAIRSPNTDDVYIGSTCNSLSRRMAHHRAHFKKNIRRTSAFSILQHGDAYIELIECFPCKSRDELHKKEGEIIRATPNCVNQRIAGRDKKQYYIDNLDEIKQRYIDNKDKIKQYIENNRDKIKAYKKRYSIDHRDEIKDYNKRYRDENKDKLKLYFKQYYERRKINRQAKKATDVIESNEVKTDN